ncbi:TIGR01777 family protein [Acidobacteria bacterium AB60]|nr:TIGR01777 family protein [Acidobacteria bacterium AB60]
MTQNNTYTTETVLISGASGMLGSALKEALREAGTGVVQLVRRPSAHCCEMQWDGKSALDDEKFRKGFSAAIHLSGANVAAHRWNAAYRREIRESRVATTRNLARALAALPQPPAVMLVASATGIYGNRADEVLNEDSPPGNGFLADLCRDWEAAAQPARDAGIRVVHLRFGVVLSAGAGALGKMTPLFRLGLGGPLGSGRQWISWIGMPDLVQAVLFLLRAPHLAGPFNIVAPHPVTNAEFTRALARALHRPAFLRAPAFALRLALGPMADETLLSSARVLPQRLLDAGFHFAGPTLDQALPAALEAADH